MKTLTKTQIEQVDDFMSNGLEHTSDEEAFQYLIDTLRLTSEQATFVMEHKHTFLTDPFATLSDVLN